MWWLVVLIAGSTHPGSRSRVETVTRGDAPRPASHGHGHGHGSRASGPPHVARRRSRCVCFFFRLLTKRERTCPRFRRTAMPVTGLSHPRHASSRARAGEVQSWRVAGFGSRDLDAQDRRRGEARASACVEVERRVGGRWAARESRSPACVDRWRFGWRIGPSEADTWRSECEYMQ